MFIPECESPKLLINRSAINYIAYGGKLYINNQPSNYINKSNLHDFSASHLFKMIETRPYLIHQHESNIEQSFVLLPNGHRESLFIYVPCGHCLLCHHRKQIDFVARCNMESQLYNCPPYFFTLTYKPSDLPFHGELRYKDVQDFFKRLRKKWSSRGLSTNIRYVVAGEYGSDPNFSHRPHYHVIMWNNPYNANELNVKAHNQLKEDIFTAWSHSELQSFDFGQCAGGAAAYVSKYISKPCNTYGRWTKPFIHSSCRNGGIGSSLILSKLEHYRDNPQKRVFTYYDYNTNLFVNQNFGSYITQKLWPSLTRLVPTNIKAYYKEFSEVAMHLFSLGGLSLQQTLDYIELVRPYKSVIVNRFSQKYINSIHITTSGLCSLYYQRQLFRVLNELGDLLCVADDIPQDYIDKYFKFKSYNEERAKPDITYKLLDLKQKMFIECSKESL